MYNKGPFPDRCLSQWWSSPVIDQTGHQTSDGCTTDITKNPNYSTWSNTVMTTDDLKHIFTQMKTAKDNTSSMACYGKAIYDVQKISTVTAEQPPLSTGQKIWSEDSHYYLELQEDGSLALKGNVDSKVLWTSTDLINDLLNTDTTTLDTPSTTPIGKSSFEDAPTTTAQTGFVKPYKAGMTPEGNFVISDANGKTVWETGTVGKGNKLAFDVTTKPVTIKIVSIDGIVLWISSCTAEKGPYTRNCLVKWWTAQDSSSGADGCATDITLNPNYTDWTTKEVLASDVKDEISKLKHIQDESSTEACYGTSKFNKYHIIELDSGESLSSIS
jgi:hypothetical protein